MKYFPDTLYVIAIALTLAFCLGGCRDRQPGVKEYRGVPKEQLVRQQEEILERHDDGSPLSRKELRKMESLQEQAGRLDNPWVFGEWRERHGARLVFRDDGTVSVGAREGSYDALGVFKFTDPSEAYEGRWTITSDPEGNPVVTVTRPDGGNYLYFFRDRREAVEEMEGDIASPVPTGCFFTKMK